MGDLEVIILCSGQPQIISSQPNPPASVCGPLIAGGGAEWEMEGVELGRSGQRSGDFECKRLISSVDFRIVSHSEVAESQHVTSVTYRSRSRRFRIVRGAIEIASAFKSLGSHACLPHGGAVGGVRPTPARPCSCSF